jgi:putative transposase
MGRKAFRYRLYPNQQQAAALTVQFGHARFVYNWALATRKEHYQQQGHGLSYYELKRQLTALKHEPEHAWLQEADSQVLQAKVEDLDRAYRNFFAHRARYPRFKSRKGAQSIRYPQRFQFNGNRVYLPKVGWVKVVLHRLLEGTAKSLTVSKTKSGEYYVSVQCEVEPDVPVNTGPVVGVDLGLHHFAVLSTGEKIEHPQCLRQSERRLQRLQRRLSRKQKGSRNREKARLQLARQHEHVARQRQDFLHKLSHRLVSTHSVIKLEDLNVAGMVQNHTLAKSISDSGWGAFGRMCEYKAPWYGAVVERVDRFYPSSKTCHVCGLVNDDLQLSHRIWTCAHCGTVHDRDHNAALVLKRAPTVGATGRYTPGEIASAAGGSSPGAAVVEPGSPRASSPG